jgi:hypothetical protein
MKLMTILGPVFSGSLLTSLALKVSCGGLTVLTILGPVFSGSLLIQPSKRSCGGLTLMTILVLVFNVSSSTSIYLVLRTAGKRYVDIILVIHVGGHLNMDA